jgi:hypothetical protein
MARVPSTDLALMALVGKRLEVRSCHGTVVGRLAGRVAPEGRLAPRTQWQIDLDGGGTEIFWPERCVIFSAPEAAAPANDSSLHAVPASLSA